MSGISQEDAFDLLARRLDHARAQHPIFAESNGIAFTVIDDELDELFNAMLHEGPARIVDEALDVAATAMRLVMGEVKG